MGTLRLLPMSSVQTLHWKYCQSQHWKWFQCQAWWPNNDFWVIASGPTRHSRLLIPTLQVLLMPSFLTKHWVFQPEIESITNPDIDGVADPDVSVVDPDLSVADGECSYLTLKALPIPTMVVLAIPTWVLSLHSYIQHIAVHLKVLLIPILTVMPMLTWVLPMASVPTW